MFEREVNAFLLAIAGGIYGLGVLTGAALVWIF